MGKSVFSDLEEGKQTYLTAKAFENSNAQTKKKLERLLRKKKITKNDFGLFQEILVESGSKDYSEKLAQRYLAKALKELEKTPFNKSQKAKLSSLALYIVKRNL